MTYVSNGQAIERLQKLTDRVTSLARNWILEPDTTAREYTLTATVDHFMRGGVDNTLSDSLKEYFKENFGPTEGLEADLIGFCFELIDWQSIAETACYTFEDEIEAAKESA
jgi:hypothetical protein